VDNPAELGITRVQAVAKLGITTRWYGAGRACWGNVDGLSTGSPRRISLPRLGRRQLSTLSTSPTINTIVNYPLNIKKEMLLAA
jgi:hypothetical protein